VKNQNVRLNALIKDARCLTARNALLFVNNPTASHIVKLLSLNVSQFVKNLNAIGNVINQLAPNQNVNLFVKIPIVYLKLNAVLVLWELQELLNLSHSSKNQPLIRIVVSVNINY